VPIATNPVQVQGGADVERVAQAGLGRIPGDIARPARQTAASIIGRHDTPARADRIRERLEIAGGPHDAGQAEQRRVRTAALPFADNERKTVPRGKAMDYCVHCASRVGVVSPRRAR
jgi:hypothetical protein